MKARRTLSEPRRFSEVPLSATMPAVKVNEKLQELKKERQDNWGVRLLQKGRIESFYLVKNLELWVLAEGKKTGNKQVKVEVADISSDPMNNYRNQEG